MSRMCHHKRIVMYSFLCVSNLIMSCATLCRVYRRLESIPTSHDEEEEKVAAELAELLGPERMPWLQLVHQLIVSEEVMQAEQ